MVRRHFTRSLETSTCTGELKGHICIAHSKYLFFSGQSFEIDLRGTLGAVTRSDEKMVGSESTERRPPAEDRCSGGGDDTTSPGPTVASSPAAPSLTPSSDESPADFPRFHFSRRSSPSSTPLRPTAASLRPATTVSTASATRVQPAGTTPSSTSSSPATSHTPQSPPLTPTLPATLHRPFVGGLSAEGAPPLPYEPSRVPYFPFMHFHSPEALRPFDLHFAGLPAFCKYLPTW